MNQQGRVWPRGLHLGLPHAESGPYHGPLANAKRCEAAHRSWSPPNYIILLGWRAIRTTQRASRRVQPAIRSICCCRAEAEVLLEFWNVCTDSECTSSGIETTRLGVKDARGIPAQAVSNRLLWAKPTEDEGFEPPLQFPAKQISNLPPSAARPILQESSDYRARRSMVNAGGADKS